LPHNLAVDIEFAVVDLGQLVPDMARGLVLRARRFLLCRDRQAAGQLKRELLKQLLNERDARIPAMSKTQSATARARKIKLLLFDVDGVLTDGKLFIFPAPAGAQQATQEHAAKYGGQGGFGLHSQSMIEAKGFHAHDGTAISLARLAGIKTGLITKRISETVALRARDLKLEYVYQGIQDKRTAFEEILRQEELPASEAAFVGDDVIDLPVMWHCGLAIAVANARAEVKKEAHYVTPHSGGDGALRDAVEYILKAQGKWRQVVEQYIGERSKGRD
jgi:3-deoxy-D-manno-octulosonate 8-phosphate phosphatase (KDO 8-P phosphatase)